MLKLFVLKWLKKFFSLSLKLRDFEVFELSIICKFQLRNSWNIFSPSFTAIVYKQQKPWIQNHVLNSTREWLTTLHFYSERKVIQQEFLNSLLTLQHKLLHSILLETSRSFNVSFCMDRIIEILNEFSSAKKWIFNFD